MAILKSSHSQRLQYVLAESVHEDKTGEDSESCEQSADLMKRQAARLVEEVGEDMRLFAPGAARETSGMKRFTIRHT